MENWSDGVLLRHSDGLVHVIWWTRRHPPVGLMPYSEGMEVAIQGCCSRKLLLLRWKLWSL